MSYGNFKWCNPNIDVKNVPADSETDYILEVDLKYPRSLHDKHNDLPLAPERRVHLGSKESKLVTTLYGKDRYVLYYRNLKLYLLLGMKIKCFH